MRARWLPDQPRNFLQSWAPIRAHWLSVHPSNFLRLGALFRARCISDESTTNLTSETLIRVHWLPYQPTNVLRSGALIRASWLPDKLTKFLRSGVCANYNGLKLIRVSPLKFFAFVHKARSMMRYFSIEQYPPFILFTIFFIISLFFFLVSSATIALVKVKKSTEIIPHLTNCQIYLTPSFLFHIQLFQFTLSDQSLEPTRQDRRGIWDLNE